MMKRIFIITIIICLLIPFFSINISAAEYDLGDPSFWSYGNNYPGMYPLALTLDGEVYNRTLPVFLAYYKDGYSTEGSFDTSYSWLTGFETASYDNARYRIRAGNLDTSSNVLAFCANNSVRSTLVLPGLAYSDIYFPAEDQVFKIEFSVDTLKLSSGSSIPSEFNEYLKPEYLCFFQLSTASGQSNPLHVPFSSVVVEPSSNGRVLHYTYYFNAYGEVFSTLKANSDGALLKLVVRFPYYFGDSSNYSNGVFTLSNADLPSSYDILTVGGYSQELNAIENAIITSNEKLYDMYTEMSEEDIAFIVHSKAQNEKLDSTIKDYDNAQSGINNIIENVTLPPVNIDDANSTFDDIGLGNISENESIWSPFIVSMALVTFTFAGLSLLLYGKKG